jgi:hypothetical protein
MSGAYTVYLDTPLGVRLAVLPFLKLTYTLAVNTIGTCEVVLPESVDAGLFRRDSRIEVWRSIDGGPEYLEADKHWLVRKITRTIAANGSRTLTIGCVCPNDILRRRVVAYPANNANAPFALPADGVIRGLITTNIAGDINETRDVIPADLSSLFYAAGNASAGIAVAVQAARENVLETCRDVCAAAADAGAYLAFDTVWDGSRLAVNTYIGQRGVDHRFPGGLNPVILGPDFGTMTDVEITEDYTGEWTCVIVPSGPTTATDDARVAASPFNHIEVVATGINTPVSGQLTSLVQNELRRGRPVRTIVGQIQDTPGTQYGKQWGWGDRVTVQVEGINYDARVDAVTVTVEGGKETITAAIRIDDE